LWEAFPESIQQRIPESSIHAGGTALHIFVMYSMFTSYEKRDEIWAIVRFLVQKYPEALLVANQNGQTPLDITIERINLPRSDTEEDGPNKFIEFLSTETIKARRSVNDD
jgi:hypothetical protein